MLTFENEYEMYDYIIENRLGVPSSEGFVIKHLALLKSNLHEDENLYCLFISYRETNNKSDGLFAVGLTNKRLLLTQHKIFGEVVQSINLKQINDITTSNRGEGGFGIGKLTIDTLKEQVTLLTNVDDSKNIYNQLHKNWEHLIHNNSEQMTSTDISALSAELEKYKELLSAGIITEDEYNAKRTKLLDL